MRTLIAVVGGAGLLVTAGCALGNSKAGAVLTEGSRTVELEVTAGGAVQRRMVSAFAG